MRCSYLKALLTMLRIDPGSVPACVGDLLAAAGHGPRQLRAELVAWHSTVQAWQDPEFVAEVTAPFDEADYVQVSRPGRERA